MLDFLMVATRHTKSGVVEIYPKFVVKKSKDLMIRGGGFYAIWVEELGMWSDDEQDAIDMIDAILKAKADEHKAQWGTDAKVLYLWDAESGMIDRWHKYCEKQMRDNYSMLDENLIFSNTETNKNDYASKRLNYPLEPGDITAYEKLISTLYSEKERHKIEWAIGSIVSGASKTLQKFMVLYGAAGTGKSTILNIIQQLFDGYYSVFDAKALGSNNGTFALEAFKSNPLVAIQHDGDLSRIEDNTRLNSLVSHEYMTINEKFKSTYTNRFKCFLFMGTNRPVKITDAKSGLIRRLIDVTPSGDKLSAREYKRAMKQIPFELGAIAHHCREIFLEDPNYYDDYIPISMMGASNDFYNYVIDSYRMFVNEPGVTLKTAWEAYKKYCEDAKVPYALPQRAFKEELKNYFREFHDRYVMEDGTRVRNYYLGFRTDQFDIEEKKEEPKPEQPKVNLIKFESTESIFDIQCSDCPAQYASTEGTPLYKWDNVKTTLSALDTSQLHYVKVPENHIVIDFDIPDENGNKCFEKNLEEASKWPATYAELSKSGAGIHLHYIYTGDVTKLSRIYDDKIEVKVFTGKSSLRRKLTKCNNLPIASISSGLPLKGDKKMVNFESIKSEKGLRTLIKRNLNKEIHPGTKPSVDFIQKILEDAYDSGLRYDVTDMRNAVLAFAANSSHKADYCIKLVGKMKFKSDEPSDAVVEDEAPIAIYDIEVFSNLLIVNWKLKGKDKSVVRMINPKPHEIEELLKFRLIGFNCRRYDNHILYARLMGYTNEQLYNLSQKIVNEQKGFFREAYNISYTDVYDFCSKKQSLKKWEIELGIHHQELGLPWDQPVPEELWTKVAEYCDNDVIATEAVFDANQADFAARQFQVDLVKALHGIDATVNETTNSLSAKIIFGNDKDAKKEFNYRDLSKPVGSDQYDEYRIKFGPDYKFRVFNADGLPAYRDYIPGEVLPYGWSILPFFPGYTFEFGKSTYLEQEIGEGGRVFSRPGMYGNVWDGDVSSQHPNSAIKEVVFGPKYTKVFQDIKDARVHVKHRDIEAAGKLLNGALKPYLAPELLKDLAYGLKIIINSIYGMTSASFDNPFRDPRNVDNIVAKRGALFMTLLKQEVEKLGYTVAHIKTDSIKIPDSTSFIEEFIIKFGHEFGYDFETEAVFEKFCLVNDAVYIAQHRTDGKPGKWTATGTQFAVPYVFKTLFSKEPIVFEDLCETKQVGKGVLFLDMNEDLPDVTLAEKELEDRRKGKKRLNPYFEKFSEEELQKTIQEGHNHVFIGRVGLFCPIKPGCGGGVLYRVNDNKFYAATGTKGYRWLEAEEVKNKGKMDDIDDSYYKRLVDEAVESISQYGDFEWFASDEPYVMAPNICDMRVQGIYTLDGIDIPAY